MAFKLSFTPAFSAVDAPPERKQCNENSLSMATAVTTQRKVIYLGLVYDSRTSVFLSVLC